MLWWIVGAVVLVTVVAGFALLVLLVWKQDPLGSIFPDPAPAEEQPPAPYIPGFFVAHTPEVLPESLFIVGRFFRWQSREHFHGGEDLWRTFQDGPWKWEAQGRFAGREVNCGHYFSLNEAGSDAEAAGYGLRPGIDVERLQVLMRLHRILDLTSLSALRLAFDAVVERPELSDPFMAEELVEIDRGGTFLTDRVGHWAVTEGYEGILFLGARALHGPDAKKPENPNLAPPSPWDYDLFAFYLDAYRASKDQLNLVLFRGRHVLSRIKWYQFGTSERTQNPFWDVPESGLEESLRLVPGYAEYDEDYQERKRRVHFRDKIRYTKLR